MGELAAIPGSSPLYLPGLHALARGSCWQEPAYVAACCDSLPSLLVQIEAVEVNWWKCELEQVECWPASCPVAAGQQPMWRSSRNLWEALLPGWLGNLSEDIFLPQFNLPGAQVIALLLTKRSFNAFPHPQPFHFAIYSLLHSLLAVFEIGHRDMYEWKTKGEVPNYAVTINGRASSQRVRLIMPNPD